jgi:hypothetical protein
VPSDAVFDARRDRKSVSSIAASPDADVYFVANTREHAAAR